MRDSFRKFFYLCMMILSFNALADAASIQESLEYQFQQPPVVEGNSLILRDAPMRLQASGGYDLPLIRKVYRFPAGTQVAPLNILQFRIAETTIQSPLAVLPPKPTITGQQPLDRVSNPLCGNDYYPNKWYDLELMQGLDPGTLQPTLFAVVTVYPVRVYQQHVQYISEIRLQLEARTPEQTRDRDRASLLIIAPQEFLDVMSDYIAHKESLGIPTLSLSLESIQEMSLGRDLPEKIKYAIENTYRESATRFVLLAGDAGRLPVRYTFHAGYGGMNDWRNTPADLYYADLYDGHGIFCSWDGNENDIFGEYSNGDIDMCDFMPDVLIGRIPATTTGELQNVLTKIIRYETTLTGEEEWLDRVILAGADTFTESEHGDTTGVPEGEATKELIAEESLNAYELIKLYETDRFPRTHVLTTENLIDAIESGGLYVNFANHGWVAGWAFEGGFDVNNAFSLRNRDKLPIVFGYACSTGVFDTENPECPEQGYIKCLAEAFMLNPDGGSVAYYGATRTAFAGGFGYGGHNGAMGFLDRSFFKGVHQGFTNQGHLGLNALSSLLLEKGLSDTADYITVLEFEYFGDPSLAAGPAPARPEFTIIDHGSQDTTPGDQDGCWEPGESIGLNLAIANDGAAAHQVVITLDIDHSDITLINDMLTYDEISRGGIMEISNLLQFSIHSEAELDQIVPITISISSLEGSFSFSKDGYIGAQAYLTASELRITADNNNDTIASPGEYIDFAPVLTNIGCMTASGVTESIYIDDPWVVEYGIKGSEILDDIPAGSTFLSTKSFWAILDPMTPHDHAIPCHIELTLPDPETVWVFDLQLPVKDYVMPMIDQFTVTPAVPEPGDTITITVRALDGSGVDHVECMLRSFDNDDSQSISLYDDGLHQDGAAGDTIFGNQLTLSDVKAFYQADIYASDQRGMGGTIYGIGGLSTVLFRSDHDILIVCGADNDLYLGLYTQALDDAGYEYDVWSSYRGLPTSEILDRYLDGVIILFYSHTYPFLEESERSAISYYLSKGGNLLITEQDIGWAMVEMGTPETIQWYHDTLLADYISDSVTERTIIGNTDHFPGLELSIEGGSGAQNQDWPSLIEPVAPAQTCFTYKDFSGPNTGTAGICADRDGAKHIYLAFGFEGIATQGQRRDAMEAMMDWFGMEPTASHCPWDQSPGWWYGPEIPVNYMYTSSAFCQASMRIYQAGGYQDSTGTTDPSIYYLDTQTHLSGDTGAELSEPRFYHATACLDDQNGSKLYFIGGMAQDGTAKREIEMFDPVSGIVEVMDQDLFPYANAIPGAWAVTGNKFYLLSVIRLDIAAQMGETWVFDPLAPRGQRWSSMGISMNSPRIFCPTAVYNNKIYAFGGLVMDEENPQYSIPLNTIEILDLSAETPSWNDSAIQPMNDYLFLHSAVVIPAGSNVSMAGKILLAGGYDTSSCQIYDPEMDTWKDYWSPMSLRALQNQLILVPSPRGPEVWALGSYFQMGVDNTGNTEILHLGDDPEGSWIGIRTNHTFIPGGCNMTVSVDLAGELNPRPIDCYVAMEIAGFWYFLTSDPTYPTFSSQALPLFAGAPLSVDFTYSGPLLQIPIPPDIPSISGAFYAATIYSGTADLAGGFAWTDFYILGN